MYTHSTGVTDTLESYLVRCRAGYYVYHRIDHPVAKMVVSGTPPSCSVRCTPT